MIQRLDHVAIAVRRLEERIPFYRDLLGMPLSAVEEVREEKVRVAILGSGAGRVELLEASGAGSPVEKFLRERGEGIHHLCFVVDSVEQACDRLRAEGVRLVGGIREGSEGSKIAFLHPKDAGGVLIELREARREPARGDGAEP
ncbi:MAG TPA: methylmalonyl-CoA epimerase [Candidatus Polarisedimenticolia bacterium]|nr:methylmalonyl-CoA epimerase [Candidatus Polarisedimenticolia bacterium]